MLYVAALPGAGAWRWWSWKQRKTGSAAAREQSLAVQCRVVHRAEQLAKSEHLGYGSYSGEDGRKDFELKKSAVNVT